MDNKYALVTGASSGIGRSVSKVLHKKGYNLLIVARNFKKLRELKSELDEVNSKLNIEILSIDLSKEGSAKEIFSYTEKNQITVDVLVNNAGIGYYSKLIDINEAELYSMIMLNMYSLTVLCKLYGKQMQKRKEGYVLNIASLSAYQPVPYIAAYAASKSYVLNFSEAIAMELKDSGVTVTCVSPGQTDTNFFSNAGIDDNHKFYGIKTRVDPDKVAEYAINSLFNNRLSCIYGLKNNIIALLNKFFPRMLTVRIAEFLSNQTT